MQLIIWLYQINLLFLGLPELDGLLSVQSDRRVEFWNENILCSLPDLRRELPESWQGFPSITFIGETIVACYVEACDKLEEGASVKMADTLHNRTGHSTAIVDNKLLLVGGFRSPNTTEMIAVPGGEVEESFNLLGEGIKDHCSIQTSKYVTVLTGGYWRSGGSYQVTEFSGLNGVVTRQSLPGLNRARTNHACGQYLSGQSQVISTLHCTAS